MDVAINILNERAKIPIELIEACGEDNLIARIFYNRGYKNPDTVKIMLNDEYYSPTLPEEFPDMDRAVKRLLKAIDSKELICIYGDYDVDGVTSTVTLVECLKNYTESVIYHVPDRFTEGYGMNEEVIKNLHKKGVSLIITCDCGISNINEINLAKELKMDVILTDHHSIPDETPCADVILNPKLLEEGHRARNISGCAMAYFLCIALLKEKGDSDIGDEFLDLLAMSLIADVVSLNGENRYLLKKSLPCLINTERIGLCELFNIVNKNGSIDNEEDIAFQIAPRINAAGRMDTARLPVELLLCKELDLAKEMAEKIDILNSERKRVQQKIIDEAIEMVETQKKNKTVLVLYGEFWHHGIVGIAAGRICELYGKPSILLSIKDDGSTVVGSARSIEEINIYELIKECSGNLLKFGGHSQAAGLSLKKENLEDFVREIEITAEKKYFIKDTIIADVDMELCFEEISEELLSRLQSAGPYGEGFRAPEFYSSNVRVISDRKTEKNHHIMVLEDENNIRIPAVKWFGEDKSLEGKIFDITYKIGINTYRGNNNIQLTLGHMVESSGIKKVLFEGNIIDERKLAINTLLLKYKDAQIFYEGLRSQCSIDDTVNRFNIKPKKDVVFLSPPANTSIFREIIALADPENIIINFTLMPDYSFKGFLMNFLGTIKYTIKNKDGREYTEVFSQKLCVEESIIKASLKYLKAKGMIVYILSEDHSRVFLFQGNGKVDDKNIAFAEKSLKNALVEKNAYKEFILKMEGNKFKEYLK
ncbi:single-stranded-DNA-specific exonuclease RecJ [Herbivorax sp. ANBcel31]|uniref:single-stranded-DNA-specific exonuclease RecJ n=1 Tax=Herbivorax sp. ANBcel31 TaxID=3069754 RepID=UPI0027B3D122|nr:single-stranded-DNA-specific exonuclease RecJ [Herbivorax sp. ANBcel31]MDQ2087037.1 single-stranded-DNA-specific exonuclease RecJ [Herbivorax sp. ANBcel31]